MRPAGTNRASSATRARRVCAGAVAALLAAPGVSTDGALEARAVRRDAAALERVMLVGIGDSLTHGTMDATNNAVATENAFLQKVADKLALATKLRFRQPLYDLQENRLQPYGLPTNLGVDGADSFTIEGLRYHKRAGTTENVPGADLVSSRSLPFQLESDYEKVLYPINLRAGKPVSQIDAAVWQLTEGARLARSQKAIGVLWIGNNDSSGAALGTGGTPERQPIPFDQIKSELPPLLRALLRFAQRSGEISFEPYTQASLAQVLTDVDDFDAQFNHVLDRLQAETAGSGAEIHWYVISLPYYSSVGYLIDSDDLEYYLRKFEPTYSVPASFKRVGTNPVTGDRVSLLTFGFMLSLIGTGHSVAEVNAVLETPAGVQNDGMVLSEAEQQFIMARIDAYNASIAAAVAARGPNVHLLDVGGELNRVLTGQTPVVINGHQISRKWTRGGSFSLDGVHPGYLGQAFIANMLQADLETRFGWDLPAYDLSQVHSTDPYVDHDGDGWSLGPPETAPGFAELLAVLTDPDDADAAAQATIPADIWERIAGILIKQFRTNPVLAREADRLGLP